MEHIVERLNRTFEEILPTLRGVYIGRLRTEMESMYHLAYWLFSDKHKSDSEVYKSIFNMAPFKLGETTKYDLEILINKAKELC